MSTGIAAQRRTFLSNRVESVYSYGVIVSATTGSLSPLSFFSESLNLKFVGKVRDPLHDTIPFTWAEKQVMGHSAFQRLRRIQQTAFIKYVFPGATHTRFEHSLGVMHLAGIMLQNLVSNQKRMLADLDNATANLPQLLQGGSQIAEMHYGSVRETREALDVLQSDARLAQSVRFAGMLHDVGHAPFSHSCERFMPTWGAFETALSQLKMPEYLKTAFATKCQKLKKEIPGATEIRIRHEVYTLMIVAKIFCEDNEFLDAAMGQDVCAIIDTSVPPFPGGALEKSGLRSLFHEIVSGELDVDRMDYLLRDARQCGVVYGLFDAGRILDSTGFYFQPMEKKFHLAIRRSGVSAFEDFLRARWSMYQQVYFHKTATACEAMLECAQKSLGRFTLPLELEEYLKLDDYSFYEFATRNITEENNFGVRLLKDLLFDRKLWKRVYEENTPMNAFASTPSLCPATLRYLRGQGVPCEMIESGTSLTRFSPKGRHQKSENSLKVIVKDVHSLRFLEPIENHSRLVNRMDEEILIRRIFVSKYKEDGTIIDPQEVQQNLSSSVIAPRMD